MKKIFLSVAVGKKTKFFSILLLPVVLIASGFAVQVMDNSTAQVEQVEGYWIFIMSKPVKAYEYLGSVKAGLTWNGQPEQDFKSVLKKVKKEYPKADGIIFQDMSLKKVDAIKFKN